MPESAPDTERLGRLLNALLGETRFIGTRLREWESSPSDSVAGAWAPLLLEKLRGIERCMDDCLEMVRGIAADEPNTVTTDLDLPRGKTMAEIVAEAEKKAILDALEAAHGNHSQAVRLLGMNRSTYYNRLREFGIEEA